MVPKSHALSSKNQARAGLSLLPAGEAGQERFSLAVPGTPHPVPHGPDGSSDPTEHGAL